MIFGRRRTGAAALVVWASGAASTEPNGGTVVAGSATILGEGTGSVTVHQSSQKAIGAT